ncbi:hypothetical protein BU24DRAFT_424471 [Aaosphaeria arxii CBS 175.79]|uniref:Uncharacterized protein n=1 Tax=Aaosphaeria arxii CBS 175.79 TaxID=1450172 RepID=A0A6A5XKW7_9PLEO|nr:uncharacterized protein BU24DRAFT_424471 [Aaosphaeria arxii CBS 175.79]KAF2013457.1 hypothetical protein BU24DRAFT_424471 [Aaosphaeria arxii CBS 175.79]
MSVYLPPRGSSYTLKRKSPTASPPNNSKKKELDVGQIRTDAPEGTRFLVLRDNHSATTPRYHYQPTRLAPISLRCSKSTQNSI